MSGSSGAVGGVAPQPTTRRLSGAQRGLIVALSVVLTLALLGALGYFVVLPALGCPKSSATSAGAVSEYCFLPFTGGGRGIGGLTAGPDRNLWFTESSHIGRMTPAGAITEFARPTTEDQPGAIVAGPDGNLWFVAQSAKAIGRITPQGAVTQFPLPTGDTYPVGLIPGPDGALCYTRAANVAGVSGPPNTSEPGLIGRITVTGQATEFPTPTLPAPRPLAQPRDIVAGPDGALWFDTGEPNAAISGDSWIGRITTGGQASIVYAPDPQALVSLTGLTAERAERQSVVRGGERDRAHQSQRTGRVLHSA
jgi:hypothetical protein